MKCKRLRWVLFHFVCLEVQLGLTSKSLQNQGVRLCANVGDGQFEENEILTLVRQQAHTPLSSNARTNPRSKRSVPKYT